MKVRTFIFVIKSYKLIENCLQVKWILIIITMTIAIIIIINMNNNNNFI